MFEGWFIFMDLMQLLLPYFIDDNGVLMFCVVYLLVFGGDWQRLVPYMKMVLL